MFLATALEIDKASAEGARDSAGHAALGLTLVRAVIFALLLLFFLIQNAEFWYNWWSMLLTIFAHRNYLNFSVSSPKCFCFTTKMVSYP